MRVSRTVHLLDLTVKKRRGLSARSITVFAQAHHASLTIMDGGEHWFHTEEQLQFLDNWIKN